MFTLGSITFLTPWLLTAIAGVPVLWWILRVMPPRPKSIKFPAFFLLKDLHTDIKTAAHTPWWLLLLRSLIIILFILAMADPVLRLTGGVPGNGAVLIAVDNGWAGAANWQQRQDKLKEYIVMLRRADRAVVFLPTSPETQDGKIHSYGPVKADDAEKWAEHLKPNPWPRDPNAAADVAQEVVKRGTVSYAIYLSDGTGDNHSDTQKLMDALKAAGGLTVVNDDQVNTPFILRRTPSKPGDVAFELERLAPVAAAQPMILAAYTQDGAVLDTLKFSFPANKKKTDVKWEILAEMRSKVARFALEAPQMAATTSLTDSQWQQHPVGIVADPSRKENAGFLNEVYYLRRALEVNGAPEIDQPGALLDKQLSAIIWPDSAALTSIERADLAKWVNDGGFLIRFAGPNLSGSTEDDTLVPVHLRSGERAMEGAMTWEKPAKLGAIGQQSPLYGLDVPKDVTVTRQLLADPTPEVFERTWLQLEDGTPLMTGGNVGKGFVVLIHTTAGPDWSDFCYSGLYVEALQRMIALSAGIGDYKADAVLPPMLVMDGFGRLQPPDRKSIISAVDPHKEFEPSPATPPGLYGDDRQFHVYNLGDALGEMHELSDIPSTAATETYKLSGERSMKADFLKWALWLLALDTLLTLWLRGLFGSFVKTGATFGVLALVLCAIPAQAAEPTTADLSSSIYLAYVETGDRDTDQVSFNGLYGLMREVNARTTVKVRGVRNINLETDPLYYYPFLYWPMTDAQPELSTTAARNVQNYLGRGGMIVFDTRDQQFGNLSSATIGTRKLRQLTKNIQIPELMVVQSGHILGKTFYLLDDFPGVYSGKVWVEKEPSPSYDGVSSVVIGGNEWAAAWSKDASDRMRFLVEGGENRREYAYRFGVNLVMMSLAGNYKSDQVHVPYILERMHRQ